MNGEPKNEGKCVARSKQCDTRFFVATFLPSPPQEFVVKTTALTFLPLAFLSLAGAVTLGGCAAADESTQATESGLSGGEIIGEGDSFDVASFELDPILLEAAPAPPTRGSVRVNPNAG